MISLVLDGLGVAAIPPNCVEREIREGSLLVVPIDAPPDGRTGRRHIALRQESATFSPDKPGDRPGPNPDNDMVAAPAVLETAVFLGGKARYITRLGSEGNGPEVKILSPADTGAPPPSPGRGHLSWMQDAIRVVD